MLFVTQCDMPVQFRMFNIFFTDEARSQRSWGQVGIFLYLNKLRDREEYSSNNTQNNNRNYRNPILHGRGINLPLIGNEILPL